MKSKFFPTLLILMLMATLMIGCSSDTAEPEAEATTGEAEDVYVAVISKGFQHQFWQAVEAGTEKAADEFGVTVTFEGPETEAQVDKQVEMVQTALDKNPSALCLAALDTQALIPMLERAQEAGIPVVGFDSGVDSDIPVATAATDNLAAAALAADKMAELIGGEGQIACQPLADVNTTLCTVSVRWLENNIFGDDIDDAGNRTATVKDGTTTTNNFDPFDSSERNRH